MSPFTVRLGFHGDLPFFLKPRTPQVDRQLTERTSVKDALEACGVPHTEVDLILVDDQPVDFAHVIGSEAKIDIFPVEHAGITSFPENRLQVREMRSFVADGHLGKLVRGLRLLGIDVAYNPAAAEDRELIAVG